MGTLIVLGLAISTPAASSAAPIKTCRVSNAEDAKLGATYVLIPNVPAGKRNAGYLVRNTTCSNGKKVIKAFHACRIKKSVRGHCTTKVLGYRCTEKRNTSVPVIIYGHVTCTSGLKRVIHDYTQDI